jgi:hypothetical protein
MDFTVELGTYFRIEERDAGVFCYYFKNTIWEMTAIYDI